jgi:uncharacterized protein YqiB (DUF1249 family)
MLADSLLLPECIYRPGSFSALMLLYESNYLKFTRLVGQLDPSASRWISRVTTDNDLHLESTLLEPYTTTLKMTYWLRDAQGIVVRDPDLTVRIYHDAAQAEALSWRAQHHHQALRDFAASHAHELNQRWQRNMMLNKWLDYLLDRGHGFAG